MTIFYVLNIVCHSISVLVICSVLFTWLLMFFKKETILAKLYGKHGSSEEHASLVTHHVVALTIGVPLIIDLCEMGFSTPSDMIGFNVLVVGFLIAIYLIITLVCALIRIFTAIRSNIKPT